MKKYSQLQRIISVMMSFVILTEFSGCYTKRVFSTSDISPESYYMIHANSAIYPAYKTSVSDGIMSGSLDFNVRNYNDPGYIHVYLASDSSFTVSNDRFSLPLNSVKEINQKIRDQKKTRTLVIVLVAGAGIGLLTAVTIGMIGIFRKPVPDPPDGQNWCEYLESIEACSDGSPD
jgi:hypothetical protein